MGPGILRLAGNLRGGAAVGGVAAPAALPPAEGVALDLDEVFPDQQAAAGAARAVWEIHWEVRPGTDRGSAPHAELAAENGGFGRPEAVHVPGADEDLERSS